MNVDVEKVVRELLDTTTHLSLATVNDGNPWVCEVHFAYDKELNLYFVSELSTRHCKDIEKNKQVAGNIIRQHELNEYPSGLYFEGDAEHLINPTSAQINLYCYRLKRDAKEVADMTSPKSSRGFYKINVRNWAIFGKFDGTDKGKKHELRWSK